DSLLRSVHQLFHTFPEAQRAGSGQLTPRVLIVGIGSPHGDDQAGWIAIQTLRKQIAEVVLTRCDLKTATVPLDLTDWVSDVGELHVIDAADMNVKCGGFVRMDYAPQHAGGESLSVLRSAREEGVHGFGLLAVLQLMQRTGRLPRKVILWAISGQDFSPANTTLSKDMMAGIDQLVGCLAAKLRTGPA
ncbi:MAG: hydrogenase maturation protease, partial [Planctomycetaceae bacterium]|nr:hydrogenase maturation protease [Planctomycetaceae bacterium]